MNLSILDTAKQKYINGDEKLATAFYEKASKEGVPPEIVCMNKVTRGYLVLPLESDFVIGYFGWLFGMKDLAKENEEYKAEYIKALGSLLNIKKLFLRELSIYYFSEIAVCYTESRIVNSIHLLYDYLHKHLEEIIENDCYDIKYYIPSADLNKLRFDLTKIKAYCLNILLSYCAVRDSYSAGTTYNAYTYDFGTIANTEVYAHENIRTSSVLKPRMNMIHLDAYYDEYLSEFNTLTAELNKHGSFNSPKELRNELTYLIDYKYKRSKDPSDKEFYKIAKRLEKKDSGRDSFMKTMAKLTIIWKPLYDAMYKSLFGMDEVGSFELDTYFTRKKLFGVCDMISCATHIEVATVRWLMSFAGCCGIGVVVYLVLAVAMKFGFYLPSITIEKH